MAMTVEQDLYERANKQCELCAQAEALVVYEVPPSSDGSADQCALLCTTCQTQMDNPNAADVHHWRCLNDSMWSPVPAVQVLAWRMLTRLRSEGWPQDLLDMLYLEEYVLTWAKASEGGAEDEDAVVHLDAHGATLLAGDNVSLIKDLKVKGANFTAKQGTVVRGISLVSDNAEHIEGRVEGQRIVILTKFVKKSS